MTPKIQAGNTFPATIPQPEDVTSQNISRRQLGALRELVVSSSKDPALYPSTWALASAWISDAEERINRPARWCCRECGDTMVQVQTFVTLNWNAEPGDDRDTRPKAFCPTCVRLGDVGDVACDVDDYEGAVPFGHPEYGIAFMTGMEAPDGWVVIQADDTIGAWESDDDAADQYARYTGSRVKLCLRMDDGWKPTFFARDFDCTSDFVVQTFGPDVAFDLIVEARFLPAFRWTKGGPS